MASEKPRTQPRVVRTPNRPSYPTLNFEDLIQDKEFVAQTANGSAHWKGTGWNRNEDFGRPQLTPAPTWKPGRSNRTGE